MPQHPNDEPTDSPGADGWHTLAKKVQAPADPLCRKHLIASGLPGTGAIQNDRTWPEESRIQYLKALCRAQG
jgi:hypothetical protein